MILSGRLGFIESGPVIKVTESSRLAVVADALQKSGVAGLSSINAHG